MKAKGFTVYHSKRGADGGKDLLAYGGEIGFGSSKICVQVKTQGTPIDPNYIGSIWKCDEQRTSLVWFDCIMEWI